MCSFGRAPLFLGRVVLIWPVSPKRAPFNRAMLDLVALVIAALQTARLDRLSRARFACKGAGDDPAGGNRRSGDLTFPGCVVGHIYCVTSFRTLRQRDTQS